jgi:K+-transporting ATPase c subunit|tara:strand:+ start:2010 stop:2450 length:441 start_codon:yes stop_codon:yes gene_type:complete
MKSKMKKGNLNFTSIVMFALTLVLVISGLGYTLGYANQNYGTTFNTNISGTDIMSSNYTSLEYFVNATQVANVSYNTSTPSTSTMASTQDFITDGIGGTWSILRDLVSLTPLGEYRSLIMSSIILIGGIILAILLAQFFFNRNLTS